MCTRMLLAKCTLVHYLIRRIYMHICPTVFSLLLSNISSNNDHWISLIREVSYDSSPETHKKYTRITMSIGVRHSVQPFGITATASTHWAQKREWPQVCPSFSSPAFSRPRNCAHSLLKVCPSFSSPAFSRPHDCAHSLLKVCPSFSSPAFSRPRSFCPSFSGRAFSASP